MKHIFIDTSIFEENNFFRGKLERLYLYAKDGYLKLYTNEIVIREVKSRIMKKMATAKSNCIKLFNSKESYILGNTSHSKVIKQLKDKTYFDKESKRLCSDFDKIIVKTPFTIIPYDDIDFAKIIECYFSETPPFKEGDKKSEFPDAFILSSIEKFCEKNKIKIAAISNDKDWLCYVPKNFQILNNIDFIFEEIVREKKEYDAITFVTHLIEINKEKISTQIKKYITKNVYFENTDYVDSDVTDFALRDLEMLNEHITYIDDISVEVTFDLNIDVTADIAYPDYENAAWDNEDKVYYFLEEETFNYDFNVPIKAVLHIEYDMKDKSFIEVEVKSINSDNLIELSIDYYD